MSPRLRVILALTCAAGAAAVALAVADPALQRALASASGAVGFAALLVVGIVSDMKPMPYSFGREEKESTFTISVILLALFVYNWPVAVVVAAVSAGVTDILSNKPYYKTLFNASVYAVSAVAAAAIYAVIERTIGAGMPPVVAHLAAGVAAGLAFYVLNVTVLMLVIAQAQGGRLLQMIAWDVRDSGVVTVTLTAIAVGGSLLWQVHPAATIVLLPPIYMARAGYVGYARLRNEAESVLASVADLLDLRDRATGQHSLRVSEMAWGVAMHFGLVEEQALAIKAIARVHDLGKIAVRDAVLLKPGPLTPDETFEMQNHVEAGGQILSHLSAYQPYLAVMLQHHERPDGLGYPEGLREPEISVGARILAACDAFDTMTSDRPYRRALPREEAMAELYRKAGSQFDPRVVEALEQWLIKERRLRATWRGQAADLPIVEAALAAAGARSHPAPARPLSGAS